MSSDLICRLVPDLLRGRVKLINGYLDIDEEGSEQNNQNLIVTTPLLHWLSIHATRINLAKKVNPKRLIPESAIENTNRLIPESAIENTNKNKEDAI
jgi:hypothetical protein